MHRYLPVRVAQGEHTGAMVSEVSGLRAVTCQSGSPRGDKRRGEIMTGGSTPPKWDARRRRLGP